MAPGSAIGAEVARQRVLSWYASGKLRSIRAGQLDLAIDPQLAAHVSSARVCDLPDGLLSIDVSTASIDVHVYHMCNDPGTSEVAQGDEADGAGGGEAISNFTEWELPNSGFEGLWESLVYDTTIKDT